MLNNNVLQAICITLSGLVMGGILIDTFKNFK